MDEPRDLVIAADASLDEVDYCDDQIWEVIIGHGDPPAMTIQTSLGMRAVYMRYFPIFTVEGIQIIDPLDFHQAPVLRQFFPNYLNFEYKPVEGISVVMEYWIPESHAIAGKVTFENYAKEFRAMQFEWVGQLKPIGSGEVFFPKVMGFNTVLGGKTADLFPVCFISGGPRPSQSVYPGLTLDLKLYPGKIQSLNWAAAAFKDNEQSLSIARNLTFRNWDAEINRIERVNVLRMIDISTGHPEWDGVLAFSQNAALKLIMPGSQHLPNNSFVLSRQPDQGYSPKGDGSDHPYPWAGQCLLDAYYLAQVLLPANPVIIKDIIENALSIQEKSGAIDWKPGLAGQRIHQLAQPILSTLVLKLMEVKSDPSWLSRIHNQLIDFLLAWLRPDQDKDRDGFPEWQSAWQAGLEEWRSRIDVFPDQYFIESPGLAALLFKECQALMKIGNLDGDHRFDPWLEQVSGKFQEIIHACWDEDSARWKYRDYEAHHSISNTNLLRAKGSGTFQNKKTLSPPQRICITIKIKKNLEQPLSVVISGRSSGERIKLQLHSRHFRWYAGTGVFTSDQLFSKIESVKIKGLQSGDSISVSTFDSDFQDISTLLPFWAGASTDTQIKDDCKKTIDTRYFTPFGLLTIPRKKGSTVHSNPGKISLAWNAFILEGLISHGDRKAAGNLATVILDATARHMRQYGEIRDCLEVSNGKAIGERGSLHGLVPVGLFLRIAGIESLSRDEVILNGFNAFPEPVLIKYQGMTIMLNSDKTVVLFKNGEAIEITQPERIKISLWQGLKGDGDERNPTKM